MRAKSKANVFGKNSGMKICAYVILSFCTLLVIYPLIFLLFTSLKSSAEFYINLFGVPKKIVIANYPTAWRIGKLSKYFFNSVVITLSSVVLTVLLSTLGGYALGKMKIPGSEAIILIFMTFNFVPGIAIYVSLYKMLGDMHISNSIFSLVLPYAAWQIPFSMYIFKKFFETVPTELIEGARIDGCNEIQSFFRIVLPLVQPAMATVIVFSFISNWGELMWAQIVTSSSITYKTLPVGLLNFKTEMGVDWGPYAAGLCLVTLPLLFVFAYFQKYFIAGLTQGAVKG